MTGEVSGLPLEYLLGDASAQQFFNLRAEETLSSLEGTDLYPPQASSTIDESSSLKHKKDKLKLNIDHNVSESTGLIFSPGGSEAYVFASSGGTESGAISKTPPRKLDENVFLEFTSPRGKAVPHGERPKTVGQSDDSPRTAAGAARINRNVLQGRLEDLRTSLEFALGSDELSSAQQSTEPSPRRFLPRVPPGYSELDDNDSMASPSVARRGAMSPSMASVTSGSTTASGPTEGLRRRNLEWDSGADLGYEGIVAKQKEAAATLSTLEKLAIGNYSNFLRTEPEGKPTAKGMVASIGRGQQLLNRLPGGQDHEEDLRQMRLHKFADSLMKQRQMQLSTAKEPPLKSSNPAVVYQQKQQLQLLKSKSDTSPDVSPVRRKLKKKYAGSQRRSPGKSTSLTDLTQDQLLKPFKNPQDQISSRHSTSDLSPRSFSNSQSSQSSTGTVVHQKTSHDEDAEDEDEEEIDPRFLEALSTDPSSLPVELYAVMSQASAHAKSASNLKRNQQSQTSLNSRQSVETVITLEQLMARHKKLAHRSSRRMQESDYSLDTDEEIQVIRQQQQVSAYFEARNDAEGSEAHSDQQPQRPPRQSVNNWLLDNTDGRAQSLPPMSKEKLSKPPADTTSEDERHKEKQRTGTLDSAPIDRAKSFEYFPGESYPLQENSSSYEYLPGHMIHDTRPPTVVSNRPQGGSSSSNISPTTSPSAQSTSSNAVVSSSKKRRPRSRNQLFNDLARLSNQLMERTNHLHSAHVHQTMTFYSRLKDYISFLSMPSLSPSDARLKQQMADKILDLMKMEEEKLAEPRPLSTLLGMRPDFLDEDGATEIPVTKKIGETSTVDEADDGHDATNATNTSMKDEEAAIPGLLLDTATAGGSDILIQKLRISQMKKLRKEIRKLEKLEKVRLMKAMATNEQSPITEEELLRQINAKSDDSSISSFSSSVAIVTNRGIEGKSASGSDTAKQQKKQAPSKRKPSVATVKEFCKKSDKDTHFLTKKFEEKLSLLNKNTDFGQTFPTPRDVTTTATSTAEKQEEKKAATTNHRSNIEKKKKRQPLAYYLSIGNESPIVVGSKVLKEKKNVRDENSVGKENRNILANYLSAIDSKTITIRPKTAPPAQTQEDGSNARNTASANQQLTLQEALYLRRPGFVERSSLRAQFLKQKRDQRIEYNERYNKWCEEVAKVPALARPLMAAPPPMPKMPRLFSYREMVHQTREKYQKLPEIMYGKTELKRKNSYRTNRLKADMYKKKLQSKVLQGKTSLSHYNQILQ